jgi:hypothetical protein
MRAICRFPPPDSHVSLSAVLEPGPNPQTALPPRTATAQSNLPHNRATPHPKPTPTDTPRHHDPPLLRNKSLTSLADKPRHPNRCEFEAWHATSETLTHFNHQPTPPVNQDTRPSRHENTLLATPPAPTTCERKPNRLRELFPPQAPASAPKAAFDPKASQSTRTKPWTLALSELGHRRPTFQDAVHSANHLFARCGSIYQLKTLTEQGACEHYLAFSRR